MAVTDVSHIGLIQLNQKAECSGHVTTTFGKAIIQYFSNPTVEASLSRLVEEPHGLGGMWTVVSGVDEMRVDFVLPKLGVLRC
jgi:hypothetical protein